MIDDKLGQQLHTQATSGAALTDTEQQQLAAWYKQMDDEEAEWLAHLPPLPDVAETQARIDQKLMEIASLKQKISQTKDHTATLKCENRLLQELLRQRTQPELWHMQGYRRFPQTLEEIEEWLTEQTWLEEEGQNNPYCRL